MATVFLGNRSPREVPPGLQVHVNDEHQSGDQGQPTEGKTIVVIDTPDYDVDGKKIGIGKKLTEIRNAFNIHSTTGEVAWVESHDENFAQAVAEEFESEVGRPDDWDPPQKQQEESREAAEPKDEEDFSEKVETFLSDQRESGELNES